MYNMLQLNDDALPYSLFLFGADLDEAIAPDLYVMTAAWYGVSSTGNQANVAVERLAQAHAKELPASVKPLSLDRYMDDIDSGADTRAEVDEQVAQTKECLLRGGFKPKFVAHSREPPPVAASADGRSVGVLGMLWDTEADTLNHGYKNMNIEKKVRGAKPPSARDLSSPEGIMEALQDGLVSRRNVLGRAAEFFDPLGLFDPVKLNLKLALSELNHLLWDQPVPWEHHDRWRTLLTFMEAVAEVELPRCIRPLDAIGPNIRLLCLADAGERAGGCAIYAGYQMPDGHYSCQLVYATSKLMRNTVPRNELEAILLCAEASLVVQKALGDDVKEVFYFSDSTIALSWILNDGNACACGPTTG
jgi:hypothetical protein